jgi:predicted ABC-type ATPase
MSHFNPAEARGPHGRWTKAGAALKRMGKEAAGAASPSAPADSMAAHSRNGVFTPERKALHDKIIADTLAGHRSQAHPVATFYGGGPASGKSALKPAARDSAKIDPDEIKARLPEYQAMVKAGDVNAASYAHEESSHISKEVKKEAERRKINYVLDGTGDSSYEKMASKVNAARDAGYTTHARYVTVDTNEAVSRAMARAQKTGRMVHEPVIRETHASVSTVFDRAGRGGLFNTTELHDNNGPPGVTKMIATGSGKNFRVIDPAAYKRFTDKAKEKQPA